MEERTPEDEAAYHEKMMALTPQERVQIASQMFVDYRNSIIASLPEDLSPVELRKQLFKRIYGYELPHGAVLKLEELDSKGLLSKKINHFNW